MIFSLYSEKLAKIVASKTKQLGRFCFPEVCLLFPQDNSYNHQVINLYFLSTKNLPNTLRTNQLCKLRSKTVMIRRGHTTQILPPNKDVLMPLV
jgi:hypothetical protein